MNRKLVWENLIPNGDFETVPVGTTPTNTTAVFINGTAAGSGTDNTCFWGTSKSGTSTALFDSTEKYSGSYSMKLSLGATGSFIYARSSAGSVTHQKLRQQMILVSPSTSYTLTYWLKTNVISGSAASGGRIGVVQYSGAASALTTTQGTAVVTTTGWTQYTHTFTTQATCNFLDVQARCVGSDGAATLLMDAWFDDIVLRQTTAITRQAI